MLWTRPSRAEHYCPLHPDLTQQHCHFSFHVCMWVYVKELWRFQTTGAVGLEWGKGGHSEAWGHVEKSQSEMESSKAAGKVKRAVELQEVFFVHWDSRGLEDCNHMRHRRGEHGDTCSEAVGSRHIDFYSPSSLLLPHFNIKVFSVRAETISRSTQN